MKAKRLLETSSHAPESLRVVFTAFDMAWEELQREHPTPPDQIEGQREHLATILLTLASSRIQDPAALKRSALAVIRRGAA